MKVYEQAQQYEDMILVCQKILSESVEGVKNNSTLKEYQNECRNILNEYETIVAKMTLNQESGVNESTNSPQKMTTQGEGNSSQNNDIESIESIE